MSRTPGPYRMKEFVPRWRRRRCNVRAQSGRGGCSPRLSSGGGESLEPRPIEALEVGLLDREVEGEDREMDERRREQPRQGSGDERPAVRLEITDRVHRVLEELVRAGEDDAVETGGREEIVPVIGVTAEGVGGPHLDRVAHRDERGADDDHYRARHGDCER